MKSKYEESVACPACTEEFYLSDFRRAPKPASCHDHDSSSMTEETVSVPKSLWIDAYRVVAMLNDRPLFSSVREQMESVDEDLIAIRERGEGGRG